MIKDPQRLREVSIWLWPASLPTLTLGEMVNEALLT